MAENGRPKTDKAAKIKKPLGPVKMYVLVPEGTNLDGVKLVRSRREITDVLMANRSAVVKEFVFERTARDAA